MTASLPRRSGSSKLLHRCRLSAALVMALSLSLPAAVPAEDGAHPYSPTTVGEQPIFSLPSPAGDLSYTPGRGLRLRLTGLSLGGFTTVEIERPEGQPATLNLDDLNFFVIADPSPRLRAFGEFEVDDLAHVNERGRGGTPDASLNVVRLFGDVVVSDLLRLRAGTFLTPVGRWNLSNAAPLIWTTRQPLITEEPVFNLTTTGLMLSGSTGIARGRLGYSLYSQFLQPLKKSPEFASPDYTVGARIEYHVGATWALGSSYLASERRRTWSHLGGLDVQWQRGRVEITAELLGGGGRDLSSQWGGYLQSVFEIHFPFYLVTRYEHFDQRAPRPEVDLMTLGAAYKPRPWLSLKAGYLFARRSAGDGEAGFRSSITTLF